MNHIHDMGTRHVLLVEDFEAMRSVLKGLLLRCGAEKVDTASNGRDAVNLLRKSSYDVVMCDYNLGPGKNGQQLLEEARLNNWIHPATVWLMISAEKTSDMVSVAAEDAPDDYLLKPINESTLQTRLQKLVERKAALGGIAAAMKARDWRKALDLCNEQLAAGTKSAAEVLRLQAQLYQRLGEWPKSQAVYEGVLQRGPVPWARLGLAKVHLQRKNESAARNLLEETVRDHPQYLEAYDCLASLFAEQGDHEQEMSVLERAAAISPNSPARQAALGTAAMKQGMGDVALAAFKRSVKLAEHSSVENADPFLGMARMHSEGGAPAEAHQVLAELTKRYDSPGAQALAKSEAVRAFVAAGDTASAAQAAQELAAMAEDPANPLPPNMVLRIAETLMESKQTDSASGMLRRMVLNNHDDEQLVRRAQQVFDNAGMGDAGRELLSNAKRDATDAMSEGMSLMSKGQHQAALDSLRAAKARMPRNARVLLNFAAIAITLVEKQGRSAKVEDEARAAITDAQALRPDESRGADLLQRLARVTGETIAAPAEPPAA